MLKQLDMKEKVDMETLRHSAAHLLMHALTRLYKATPAVGPAIEGGFYHDFEVDVAISKEDLPKIEKEMKKIAYEKLEIKKKVMPIAEMKPAALSSFSKIASINGSTWTVLNNINRMPRIRKETEKCMA